MYRQIVDGFNGLPRDLAWRVKPGVNPNAVFILILECGHSYAFHDLEVPGLADYVSRFGRELDCVQCDSFLTRASKRLAGHHLSGRYAGYYDLAERQRLLAQHEQPTPKPRLSISRSELSGHVAVYTEGEFCQTCGEAFESHTLLD